MMRLNFKIGAIVKFELYGFGEPVYKVGKVTNVTPGEVTILPQLKVYRKNENSSFEKLDLFCTADDDCAVHIRRKLISSWSYVKAIDCAIEKSISERTDVRRNWMDLPNPKRFGDYTFNEYDQRTGFCKGNGFSCFEIEEA